MSDERDIASFQRLPQPLTIPEPGSERFNERVKAMLARSFSPTSPLADRVVTWRDLVAAGLVAVEDVEGRVIKPIGQAPGPIVPPPEDPTIPDVPPSAPTGLQAFAAVLSVILTWDDPDRTITAYTEIWSSGINNIGVAVLTGTSVASVARDYLGEGAGIRYYWIRHVGYGSSALKSVFNSISGTPATPAQIGNADIGTGVIDVTQLRTGQTGFYLNDDPQLDDVAAWKWFSGDAGSIIVDSTVPFGAKALAAPTTPNNSFVYTARAWPVDITRIYRLKMLARGGPSSNRRTYLIAVFYDSLGNVIPGGSAPSGWPGFGTYHYFGLINTVPPLLWTEYALTFGQGQSVTIPTNARFMRAGALLHEQTGGGGTTGQNFLAGVRMQEIIQADIIAARSIVAGSAIIDDAAIRRAQIELLAVDTARIADLAVVTAKIADLAATTAKIGDLAVTNAKIANLAVTNAKINDLSADKINVGFLAAERIQVGAVGGANIVGNTASLQFVADTFPGGNSGTRPLGWSMYNSLAASAKLDVVNGGLFGTNYVRVTWLVTINNTMGIQTSLGQAGQDAIGGVREWTTGQPYVISFYARTLGGSAVGAIMAPFNSNHGWSETTTILNPPLTTVWQRYVFVVVPSGTGAITAGQWFLTIGGGTYAPGSYDIDAVQIEPGRLVTAWAPAQNSPGEITGVRIADDTISAPKIQANSIIAGKIAADVIETTNLKAGVATVIATSQTAPVSPSVWSQSIPSSIYSFASTATLAVPVEAGDTLLVWGTIAGVYSSGVSTDFGTTNAAIGVDVVRPGSGKIMFSGNPASQTGNLKFELESWDANRPSRNLRLMGAPYEFVCPATETLSIGIGAGMSDLGGISGLCTGSLKVRVERIRR